MITEEIFASQAADTLVNGLVARIDDIPEEGPFKDVYSSVDADELYGEGWVFALIVKWSKDTMQHYIELAVYEIPHPYKSCRMFASGTKEDIVSELHNPCLRNRIAETVPSLHRNLENM